MLSTLAQAVPAVSSDPLTVWVGMLVSLGFSVWYGYYTTTVTIPRIVSDFREEMKLEREAHSAEMSAQREACQREMEQLANIFKLQVAKP